MRQYPHFRQVVFQIVQYALTEMAVMEGGIVWNNTRSTQQNKQPAEQEAHLNQSRLDHNDHNNFNILRSAVRGYAPSFLYFLE